MEKKELNLNYYCELAKWENVKGAFADHQPVLPFAANAENSCLSLDDNNKCACLVGTGEGTKQSTDCLNASANGQINGRNERKGCCNCKAQSVHIWFPGTLGRKARSAVCTLLLSTALPCFREGKQTKVGADKLVARLLLYSVGKNCLNFGVSSEKEGCSEIVKLCSIRRVRSTQETLLASEVAAVDHGHQRCECMRMIEWARPLM